MKATSATFVSTVAASHVAVVRAEVLRDGAVTETLSSVVDGTVTLDNTAAVRGHLDITIVDFDGTLVPRDPTDLLAPYGNEIRVWRGVETPTGDELVSLGVFRVDTVDVVNDLEIRITGQDRSARIIDARFEEPYQVAAATNYPDAILAVIQDAYPDVDYQFATTTATTPQFVAVEGDDRWKFCQDMAAAIGMELFFDGDGVLTLQTITSGSTPVAALVEGEDGVLVAASRSWTRAGAFNRVIATGENTGQTLPVRGVATDDNPASATYYYGPFGRVPRFYSSSFIATGEQAADAAQAILLRETGTTERVSFGVVVNPALEPGDLVEIRRDVAGINENHVITSVSIPLAADQPMTGVTKATTV